MARIELYKVFKALDNAELQQNRATSNLHFVPNAALSSKDYDDPRIVKALNEINAAIVELQIAKQILTKE